MLIITGLAGAGKSIALNTLEDLGYYCIDNLPTVLLESLAQNFAAQEQQPLAVAIDSRSTSDLLQLPDTIRELRKKIDIQLLFLTAETDILMRRFSETRRPHPLHLMKKNAARTLLEAIEQERALLGDLTNLANITIDTSHYSVYQLKDKIRSVLGSDAPALLITLLSFGFKYGTPLNADFLFDVRFLPNPYWDKNIRKFNGMDQPVIDFLRGYQAPQDFITDSAQFLQKWLPNFVQDGHRAYLTVAIGCTGGQHRSVYVTEQIGALLRPNFSGLQIEHRDCQSAH